jgi:ankyrin repeat protein
MKLVLDHGADIDAQDDQGLTALMFAMAADTPEPVRFLIVRKANLELRDGTGRTALDHSEAYPDARQILLDAGAIDKTPDTKK